MSSSQAVQPKDELQGIQILIYDFLILIALWLKTISAMAQF